MNILDFRHDRQLLGRDPATFAGWDACLAAVYGLPLDAVALDLFRRCTGRTTPRPGGYAEACIITGRQSGKSYTAADVVVFEAVSAPRDAKSAGTYALLLAQDQRGAQRALYGYVRQSIERSDMLRRCVVSQTADTLALDTGVSVAVYPCRPAALRGIRARVAVVDELAFFRSSEGNPVDTESLRAVRPTLATTGGRLIMLSSPYGQTGALWDLHRRHYGRDDSETLVWVASAPTMNPTLPADYLRRMQDDDPEAYRSEVLGEFRAGLSTLLDPEALDACVADWRELPPAPGRRYVGFYDASGGRRDAAVAAVAHRDGDTIVGDVVRAWPAPHNPASVIAEAATLFAAYGVRAIEADRYAGEFPVAAYRQHGITVTPSPLDRSALYLELLPRVNTGTVMIPDDPALLRELRGLERRRGPSGRDRVDHRQGGFDDRANALSGAVVAASRGRLPGDIGITF